MWVSTRCQENLHSFRTVTLQGHRRNKGMSKAGMIHCICCLVRRRRRHRQLHSLTTITLQDRDAALAGSTRQSGAGLGLDCCIVAWCAGGWPPSRHQQPLHNLPQNPAGTSTAEHTSCTLSRTPRLHIQPQQSLEGPTFAHRHHVKMLSKEPDHAEADFHSLVPASHNQLISTYIV
jgi:hypothetical protein